MAIFNSWLLFLLLITTLLSLIVGWLSHRLLSASREKILNQKIRTLRETILEQKEEITQNSHLTASQALEGEAENHLMDSLVELQLRNQNLQDSERDLQVKLSQLYTKKQTEISTLKTEMKDLRNRLQSIKRQSILEEWIELPLDEADLDQQQPIKASLAFDEPTNLTSDAVAAIEVDSQKQTIGRLENQLKIETDVYRRRIDELEEKLEFAQLANPGSSKEDKASMQSVSEQLAEKDAELIALRNQFNTLKKTVASTPSQTTEAESVQAKPKAAKRKVAKKTSKKIAPKTTKKKIGKKVAVVHDDLTLINGIGPKIKELLYKNGVTNFQQIASMKAADIRDVADKLGNFRDRIKRDDWVKQAKKLAK